MTTPSPQHTGAQGGLSPRARALIAGLFILVDAAVCLLWASAMGTSTARHGVLLASIVTLAVGALCLVAVIVISLRRGRTSEAAGRTPRSPAVGVLSFVAVLQLVGGFLAIVVAGGFADANALQVLVTTMVAAVAVLLLSVSTARGVAREAATR